MAEMKTLEVDFPDMPKTPQEQLKTMFFDFSAFPEEEKSAQPKEMPFDFSAFPEAQKPATPKGMLFDFSAFPEEQKPALSKVMFFDFSAFPEQPKPETVPYTGEDRGSQLSSYNPDSWINDKIPAAAAQPQGPKDWLWDNPLIESLFGRSRVNAARDYLEGLFLNRRTRLLVRKISDPFAEIPTPNVFQSAARLAVGVVRSPGDLVKSIVSPAPDGEQTEYNQMSDPLAEMPAAPFVKETAKGMAKFAGKPLGLYGWDEFAKAWAKGPIESVAGIMPLIGAFFKMKGLAQPTPADASRFVQRVVEHPEEKVAEEFAEDITNRLPAPDQGDRSVVAEGSRPGESGAAEPSGQPSVNMDKVGSEEMEEGPHKEELDFLENSEDAPKSGAAFGQATTNDYRSIFFAKYPELKGKVFVHHAVEQKILTKFPGVVTEGEMHSLENLRGIPLDINTDVHLSQIRVEWNRFYDPFIKTDTAPTKAQLLQKATEIDSIFGSKFMPAAGGEWS